MQPSTAKPSGVFQRLRSDTAAQHQALDDKLGKVFASLTRERYTALLQAMYGFVAPWEVRFHEVADDDVRGFFADRAHARRLEADLLVLDSPPSTRRADVTRCMRDVPSALGSAYVIEGSMLGGQLLRRIVEQSLGFTRDSGCAYFGGYGERTGSQWKSFQAFAGDRLTSLPVDQSDEVVGAASRTFEVLHDWLQRERVIE